MILSNVLSATCVKLDRVDFAMTHIKGLKFFINAVSRLPNGHVFEMNNYYKCVIGKTVGLEWGTEKAVLQNYFGIAHPGGYKLFSKNSSEYYTEEQWSVIKLFTPAIGEYITKEEWLKKAHEVLNIPYEQTYNITVSKTNLDAIINNMLVSKNESLELYSMYCLFYNQTNCSIKNLTIDINKTGVSSVKLSNLKKLQKELFKLQKSVNSTKNKIDHLSAGISAIRSFKKGESKKPLNDLLVKYSGVL